MSPIQQASRIPAPIGRAPARKVPADTAKAAWSEKALGAFASHSFTGKPDTERWCTRCALVLPADWLDARKPVPLACGDARIVPRRAVYEYVFDNGQCRIRPVGTNRG